MEAYRHLIKHALREGFPMSVFSGGDEPDLSRSSSFGAVMTAVESVGECDLVIHGHDGKRMASVLIVPDLADDETVADWSAASDAANSWLEVWAEDYADHQNRVTRLMY